VSGGSYYTVESVSQVSEWKRDENHVNPVTIRMLGVDVPAGENPGRYYPMFGLAVEYLLDAKGRGRTLLDVKNMLTDMGRGASFSSAFQTYMGISVDAYRAQFYDLIEGFLTIY
jgi:hypothetical protein